MAVRTTRRDDNGSADGAKQRNYFWKVMYILISFIIGGGISAGGLQVMSPTNVQVQQDLRILTTEFKNYIMSHKEKVALKEANIDLRLENIQEDIREIKRLLQNER